MCVLMFPARNLLVFWSDSPATNLRTRAALDIGSKNVWESQSWTPTTPIERFLAKASLDLAVPDFGTSDSVRIHTKTAHRLKIGGVHGQTSRISRSRWRPQVALEA